MRALMPQKTKPATIRTASTSKNATFSVRGRVGGNTGPVVMGASSMDSLSSIGNNSLLMQHAEYRGDEEQCSDGGADQATDHGAAERGVLFAAFTQAHGHGDHSDNHGERGHQHGTKAREAGFESGARGIACGLQVVLGEADHQDAVGGGHADAHDGAH